MFYLKNGARVFVMPQWCDRPLTSLKYIRQTREWDWKPRFRPSRYLTDKVNFRKTNTHFFVTKRNQHIKAISQPSLPSLLACFPYLPASHLTEPRPPGLPQVLIVNEPLPCFERLFAVVISYVGQRETLRLAGWTMKPIGRVHGHLQRSKQEASIVAFTFRGGKLGRKQWQRLQNGAKTFRIVSKIARMTGSLPMVGAGDVVQRTGVMSALASTSTLGAGRGE